MSHPSHGRVAEHDAIIVGAGFGGMGAAIALRRLGYDDLLVLEREDDLGGTWHVNRYPGLAVDIPSATYSYSFEPNPYWSRLFAPGDELKRYAEHVADTYDLRRHMRFGVVVEGAAWDDDAAVWRVSTREGASHTARYLVTATGFLSQPRMPEIDGIESFAGQVLHTATWDDSADLAGKRVAVIGTGATAVQLIPEIVDQVGELTVFQRTAIWVAPKVDFAVPALLQRAFAAAPLTQRAVRLGVSAALELLMIAGVLHYNRLSRVNRGAESMCRRHLEKQVSDPELRRKLTPAYSFGCKRPTFSNDYYPALTRPHAHVETTAIDCIDGSGIVTVDGARRDVDVLVCATGYNLWDANFPAIEVIGRDGRNLGSWWRQTRFQAYEGIAVPKFPNFLPLNAPYSYNGLNYFTTIESQMRHMERLFTGLQAAGASTFEVTEKANTEFLERMRDRVGETVFSLGDCSASNSYYFNQHGEATLLRPTSTSNSLREAGRFPLDSYRFTA
jgi:cation diffusion facilitator CzcD-associated flavoprotein CzcO